MLDLSTTIIHIFCQRAMTKRLHCFIFLRPKFMGKECQRCNSKVPLTPALQKWVSEKYEHDSPSKTFSMAFTDSHMKIHQCEFYGFSVSTTRRVTSSTADLQYLSSQGQLPLRNYKAGTKRRRRRFQGSPSSRGL